MKYKTVEQTEGGSIERVFSTDQLGLGLFVARVTQMLREVQKNPILDVGIGGSILGDFVIKDNVIYFGACDKNLYAITLDGKELWRFQTNHVVMDPTIYSETIYFGSFDGNLYAVTLGGKLLWKFNCGSKIESKAAVHEGTVYFGATNGNFHALDLNGKLKWKFYAGATLSLDTIQIKDDRIYFGSLGGVFYCIDLDGNLVWKFEIGGPVAPNPLVQGDKVFFGGWDCNFYCITTGGRLVWKFPTSLSYVAPVNVEEAGASPEEFRVVWEETPQETEDRYKAEQAGISAGFSPYVNISQYTEKSVYARKARGW